ncbi:MAG TPA: sugar phosphate isomerase/epimerase family protein [Ilumatobacteraceae bacterium]
MRSTVDTPLSFSSINFSPRFGCETGLVDVLQAAASTGYRCIGLDVWSVSRYAADGGSLASLPGLLASLDLRCTDVVAIPIQPDRDATLAAAHRAIELAVAVGATVIGGGVAVESGIRLDADVRTAFGACAAVVADAGLRLALEYIPDSAVDSVPLARELCAEVGWDRAGLLVDSWQTFVANQMDALAAAEPGEIAMVQIGDAVLPLQGEVVDEMRNRRLVPGAGNLDLPRFVEFLRTRSDVDFVALEVLSASVRSSPPVPFARAALRAFDRLWS